MKNPLRTSDSKTLPLTVSNTGFLLDRLGQDCHPLQFLRELTQNAIEAIHRTPEKTGEIIWDVDWTSYELEQPGQLHQPAFLIPTTAIAHWQLRRRRKDRGRDPEPRRPDLSVLERWAGVHDPFVAGP